MQTIRFNASHLFAYKRSNSSIWHIDLPESGPTTPARVALNLIAMKEYSTFP